MWGSAIQPLPSRGARAARGSIGPTQSLDKTIGLRPRCLAGSPRTTRARAAWLCLPRLAAIRSVPRRLVQTDWPDYPALGSSFFPELLSTSGKFSIAQSGCLCPANGETSPGGYLFKIKGIALPRPCRAGSTWATKQPQTDLASRHPCQPHLSPARPELGERLWLHPRPRSFGGDFAPHEPELGGCAAPSTR